MEGTRGQARRIVPTKGNTCLCMMVVNAAVPPWKAMVGERGHGVGRLRLSRLARGSTRGSSASAARRRDLPKAVGGNGPGFLQWDP